MKIINTASKKALNEIQFMTLVDLLRVSALRCHPKGIFRIKTIDAHPSSTSIALPSLE